MGDDIREIETQNRALQILNSNQHALISELDELLVCILFLFFTVDKHRLTPFVDCYLYTP